VRRRGGGFSFSSRKSWFLNNTSRKRGWENISDLLFNKHTYVFTSNNQRYKATAHTWSNELHTNETGHVNWPEQVFIKPSNDITLDDLQVGIVASLFMRISRRRSIGFHISQAPTTWIKKKGRRLGTVIPEDAVLSNLLHCSKSVILLPLKIWRIKSSFSITVIQSLLL
jgi:hypothetical protein